MLILKYHNGAFIAQHGSWNRPALAGYKVIFIPFNNGKPSGTVEDFLTRFIANASKSKVYGRPVCVAILNDSSMLVTDDASNTIWRVSVNISWYCSKVYYWSFTMVITRLPGYKFLAASNFGQ